MERQWRLVLVAAAVAIGSVVSARAQGVLDGSGPAYSLEGAWVGTVAVAGLPPVPSMDTFTASARESGSSGTFLCTIPSLVFPNPMNASGWITGTQAGHGNWTRVDKNRFAFTAWRIVTDQDGAVVGMARFWGVITPVSDGEYSGTMNVQFLQPDGSPLFPITFTGTLNSKQVEVVRE